MSIQVLGKLTKYISQIIYLLKLNKLILKMIFNDKYSYQILFT